MSTFSVLLFAHVAADFLFQSDAMVAAKNSRSPGALVLHGSIVGAAAAICILPVQVMNALPLVLVAVSHVFVDFLKSLTTGNRLKLFVWDQLAHVAVLVGVAHTWPNLFADGAFGGFPLLPSALVFVAGAIIAMQVGSVAVKLLLLPWSEGGLPEGLSDGGHLIGIFERGLIFILVLSRAPEAVGFLIAAKTLVVRFDTSGNPRAAEYVIVGTLASFFWGVLAAYATLALLDHLPALGILPPSH